LSLSVKFLASTVRVVYMMYVKKIHSDRFFLTQQKWIPSDPQSFKIWVDYVDQRFSSQFRNYTIAKFSAKFFCFSNCYLFLLFVLFKCQTLKPTRSCRYTCYLLSRSSHHINIFCFKILMEY
jgi:hypothetical protein